MTFEEKIESTKRNLSETGDLLGCYINLSEMLKGVDFSNADFWVYRFASGNVDFDIRPSQKEGSPRDLQPIIHKLTQALHVEFEKSQDPGNPAWQYKAVKPFMGKQLRICVSGVVPKTCHVEEYEEAIPQEEIDAQIKKAVDSVPTTRIVRKIVCD